MRLSVSLILCGFLIYCLTVTDADQDAVDDGNDDELACSIQYLKSKGRLENSFPTSAEVSPTKCRFIMTRFFLSIRALVKKEVEKKVPNESNCVLTKYDESQAADLALTIIIISSTGTLTETEIQTRLVGHKNELKQRMKETADECGIEGGKFLLENFEANRNSSVPIELDE